MVPRKGSTFARGEAMTIGKAYESAKIEVQECSANRPPTKESLKAVSRNKPKKVLMCNYCASKTGAHGFSGKKLNPSRGAVYRKWHRPCSSQCSREKNLGAYHLARCQLRAQAQTHQRVAGFLVLCENQGGREGRFCHFG